MGTSTRKIDDVLVEQDGLVFKRIKKGALKRRPRENLPSEISYGISNFSSSTNHPPATPSSVSLTGTLNLSENTFSTKNQTAYAASRTDILHRNPYEGSTATKPPWFGEKPESSSVSLKKGTARFFSDTQNPGKETVVVPYFLVPGHRKGSEQLAARQVSVGGTPVTAVTLTEETATCSGTLNTRKENWENKADLSFADVSRGAYYETTAGERPPIGAVRSAERPDKRPYFLQPCSVRTENVRTENVCTEDFRMAGSQEAVEERQNGVENQRFWEVQKRRDGKEGEEEEGERKGGELKEEGEPKERELKERELKEGELKEGELKEGKLKEGEQKGREENEGGQKQGGQKGGVEVKKVSMVKKPLGSENTMAKLYPRAEQWRKLFTDVCKTELGNLRGKSEEKKVVSVVLKDWIKQVLPLVICSDVGNPSQNSRATTVTRKQNNLQQLSEEVEMLRGLKKQYEAENRRWEHWLEKGSWEVEGPENKVVDEVKNLDCVDTFENKWELRASESLRAVQENLEIQVDTLESFLDVVQDTCHKSESLSADVASQFHRDSFLSLIRDTPRTLLRALASEPL